MPLEGADWGFEWGDAYWGAAQIAASDRILMFCRGPRFIALVQLFSQRTENLLDAVADVCSAFDVETATGVHLDRLGEILQLPRNGAEDDRYRILLQIQIELVLSSTTTTPTIMRIVELFTGHPPSAYAEHYPMAYTIGATLDDPADAAVLLEILGRATAAAYGYSLLAEDEDALILDFEGDPIDGAGTLDFEGDPIAGAGTLGYLFTP